MIKNKRKLLTTLILSLVLCGCHSYQGVNIKQKNLERSTYYLTEPQIYSGDLIKYKLKSGDEGEMTVSKVTPQYISGINNQSIPMGEIISLEKKELSKTKTGAAVAGGVTATVVIIGLVTTLAVGSALIAAAG
ncbi:hypothetical protein OM252_19700 [Escherichia albertii]|uniref:hypothetical protein n=1 Tax=Escherichia albertii TaxID=208962 RepID=UPI0010F7693B|nr:hypothetical protein [Escherichia albertii]EFO1265835.1 hypothetical protein [Escherichia albertii]EGE0300541.1 hypothetical protein [Escherichia albertii]MCZ8707330.1 hypothetical protein [Escherichia albertii]MCZ8812567.1 hypothetical protein [Escherichia albertii]MCZ8867569.1 hypothetical protein [Escherichia albertii]